MTRLGLALTVIVMLIRTASPTRADTEIPPLIADRPGITDTPQPMPKGYLQIESGFSYNVDRVLGNRIEFDDVSIDIIGLLFRYGLTEAVELRLGSGFTRDRSDDPYFDPVISGINGLTLGTKIRLFTENGARPNAGLVLSMFAPVGNDELTGDKIQPRLEFAASNTLSNTVQIGYNLGGTWDAASEFVCFYSGAANFVLTNSVSVFAEFFGELAQAYKPMVTADGGVAWVLRHNVQLDGFGGYVLAGAQDGWFASVGLTLRIPR